MMPDHAKHGDPRRPSNRFLAATAFILFVIAGILAFFVYWMPAPATQAQRTAEPAITTSEEPISILPRKPEGVTILAKEVDSTLQPTPDAPVAEGADAPRGFAMDLGSATSFSSLSRRFALIAANNAELGFDGLVPRATLRENGGGLEARLLVGPFESERQAEAACRNIALPANIECRAVPFRGELIARR